jgi:hypothetical protein
MLLPRPRSRPNERRKLTLDLDEKPGDPQQWPVSGCGWMKDGGHVRTSCSSACRESASASVLIFEWPASIINPNRSLRPTTLLEPF